MSVAVDGGGVWPERVVGRLDAEARLVVHLDGGGPEAVTLYVEGGRLHLAGQYGTLHAERVAPNELSVSVVPPTRRDREGWDQ